ncbi:hypothetical protein LTR36_007933 [Oleoguttula mirabilis]|uniref:Fe2OG dioxygenase domain-containing protein n=1 Tax=Oleoguttula mirabilis TaxID=1507867 RepID=A0AAV9J8U4_9PEZI|nr:hypothetical protein LTR36_007933 [Oleoguttula mirabilis]
MSSLLAMLSQQTPNIQTRKGLILLGLQNDFLSSDGKLPVSTESGFLDRLKQLVPAFREFGDVIWVRSEFEATRIVNVDDENGCTVIAGPSISDAAAAATDGHRSKRKASNHSSTPMKRMKATDAEKDEELFLTRTAGREPCCVKGSWGAEYPADVQTLADDKDMQVVKTYYSAFMSTSLLLTLRSKLITELYVCGCNTNLSVFATAMDAARYGISITLIEDCLGYRKRERHDEAIRQLVEIMEADVTTSKKAIDALKNPPSEDEDDGVDDENEGEEAEEPVRFGEDAPKARLEEDSEESEDEDVERIVRNVRSSQQPFGLALRYLSSRSERSRPAAAAATRVQTPTERAEPSRAELYYSSSLALSPGPPECRSDDWHAGRGDPDSVESEITQLSSGSIEHGGRKGSTVTTSGSPESPPSAAQSLQPWRNIADSHRPAPTTSSASKRPPRCNHPGLAALTAVAGLSQQTTDDNEKAMQEAPNPELPRAPKAKPLFGDEKESESAGSQILYDLLPPGLAETVFEEIKQEVNWQHMHHHTGEVPRLVCCQGDIDSQDGSMPVYRHPSDHTLPLYAWTPTVEGVREAAETCVGHPLNHVLIQLYRGGTDFISEHSDKTLDIVKGSNIVNVSFGAQRMMRLRTKRAASHPSAPTSLPAGEGTPISTPSPARTTYRVPMPHNSMLTMSLPTNAAYLHGINADKRPAVEFTDAEKAYGGQRISLTFRHIGTFLSAEGRQQVIWGQGATGKTRNDAKPVINGDEAESEKLVRAFGAENQASSINWEAVYGGRSDVLHLRL